MNKIFRVFLSLSILLSFFAAGVPRPAFAQVAAQTQMSGDLQKRLAAIEEKVEARRKELGIPGMSLAIVKDGQVIYMKGLGYKSFEKQVPVTPDTQFAIGSATKAFTALSVLMTQDQGKLSLDEHPRKYLSYFKINDPEINEKITVRDLLTHSSGLNRTDLGWASGKLNREEIIRLAGEAKPNAKLREKFLYQNVMYTAAGEIVAKLQNQTWENYVAQEILKPLGMLNSTVTVAEMQKVKDYSFGYNYNMDTKETLLLPMRNLLEISPAGSINSSARDMAQWLKFVLNKGELDGKRLITEKSFEEWIKPHQKIGGSSSYGLGWFVQNWKGKKVIQHGGNIDGFNSMVAMLPEENLGFVMLTNVSASPLGGEMMPIVWEGILSEETTPQTVSSGAEKEIGKYRFEAAGFDVEVKMQDGKLVAVVPNQPTYVLENIGGRKYKLGGAPDGFFITFKDNEAYLEQPQGNYTLPKVGADGKVAETKQTGAPKELIGRYESEGSKGNFVEIKEVDGKIALVVKGQPPYPLTEKEKDTFGAPPLPDSYRVKVTRDNNGKVSGIVLVQPQGDAKFKYIGETEKTEAPKITVDELMAKTVEASGGEANWRKLTSRTTVFDVDFMHQGVKGTGTSYEKAPNMMASKIALSAFGKQLATMEEYFDGTTSIDRTSFSPEEKNTGVRLEDVKLESDFYELLNWKKNFKEAKVEGVEKIDGEDAYKLVLKPEKASQVTYYISTKTFLPLKKEILVVSSVSPQKYLVSQTFSDYRKVDGVMIPFKSVQAHPGMGDIVTYVKSVKHNDKIDDKKFKP